MARAEDLFKKRTKKQAVEKRTSKRKEQAKEYNKPMKTSKNSSDQAYIRGDVKQLAKNNAYASKGGYLELDAQSIRKQKEVKRDYATNPKKKQAIMRSANPNGTKFRDHLNTQYSDGYQTARMNTKQGQPIRNTIKMAGGIAKDVVVDPVMDIMKMADYGAGIGTGALTGAFEQSANVGLGVMEGKGAKNYWNKDLIKNNVKASIDESNKTGWGHGFGKYYKDVNNRMDEEYGRQLSDDEKSKRDFALEIAGGATDIAMGGLNAGDFSKAFSQVGKATSKGAKTLDTAMKAQNELGAVAGFKAGNYQDELAEAVRKAKTKYSGGKASGKALDTLTGGNKALDDNQLIRGLNKSYNNAVGKPEIQTGKPKVDEFISRFKGFSDKIDDVGEQRRVDGRTLNKKRTQTKDGYIPSNLPNQLDEFVQEIDNGSHQISMFNNGRKKGVQGGANLNLNQPQFKMGEIKAEKELAKQLNSFSGRKKMFDSINPIKLKDETGEINFLMKDILGYKSKLGKNDNKGKGLLNTKIKKLPKGKREEFVNALNDNLFDGKQVIHKDVSYGYIRELAEKYTKNTPEQFYNEVMPKISSSLTDPSHYDKGRFLKEHGGIGEYQKYVDETQRLIEESHKLDINSKEFSNLHKNILERQEKINKRNKLAKEIYPLEPEKFYNGYNGDFSNNPLNIKDSDWRHNNQISELIDNGELSDNARRIDTNAQETFKSSPMESQMEDRTHLNKQMWDIVAGSVGDGKRFGYHKKGLEDLEKQVGLITRDMEDALDNLDFSKANELSKTVKELNISVDAKKQIIKAMATEFNKIKTLVNGDPISQQRVVTDLLGDTYKKFPHLRNVSESKPVIKPKDLVKKPFSNLEVGKGMNEASANIARRIAEQHGIAEPTKINFGSKYEKYNQQRFVENKREIQKLAELRVLQSYTKGAGGKVMDDALSLLIKSHMDNMKKSIPANEYSKLQKGVKGYINDMKKAYASYINPEGKVMLNPLDTVGDKRFYKSVDDELAEALESKALDMKYDDAINSPNSSVALESRAFDASDVKPGDKGSLTMNLQRLASKFIGDDVKPHKPSLKETTDARLAHLYPSEYKLIESNVQKKPTKAKGKAPNQARFINNTPLDEIIPDATDIAKASNTPLNKIPTELQTSKLQELDAKIASRLTPQRMEEILGTPLEKALSSSELSKAPKVGGEEITQGWRRYADKGDIKPGTTLDDIGKNNKNIDKASDAEFSRNILDEIASTSDDIDINNAPKELPKGGGVIDDVKPSKEVVEQLSKEASELKKYGIDASKEPPKTKPKNMPPNLYKKWLNTWKKGVTVYNPGWHVQNFFQNKGQNYLALGNKAFLPQTDARQIMKTINGKNAKNINVNGLGNTELADMAKKLGVVDSFGDDVQMGNKLDNSKLMQKLGESEKTARLHHWITQMRDGMSPEQAVKSVNKYLFDYGDMSKTDKAIRDYVDPFWSFHKNNAKMLVESGVKHPFRMSAIGRSERGLGQEISDEERQSEESSYGMNQVPGKSYHDRVSNADFNYLYKNNMMPDFEGGVSTEDEDVFNKLNPLLQVAMQMKDGEGQFGNKVVDGEEAKWGEITKAERMKEIGMQLNPFLPTLINTMDKVKGREAKVEDDKMGTEITEKQILNDWIKYITGNKANWYRNM